jgi:hypothetical protein
MGLYTELRKELRKTADILSDLTPCEDWNQEPSSYEVGGLTIYLQCLVNFALKCCIAAGSTEFLMLWQ